MNNQSSNEKNISQIDVSRLPVIIMENIIFPNVITSLIVSKTDSLKTLDVIIDKHLNHILLVVKKHTQSNNKEIKFNARIFYNIGVIVKILQIINLPNNHKKLLIESVDKVKISYMKFSSGILFANYSILEKDSIEDPNLLSKKIAVLLNLFKEYIAYQNSYKINFSEISYFKNKPHHMLSLVMSYMQIHLALKQKILEENILEKKYILIIEILTSENIQHYTEQSIQQKMKHQIEKTHRDFYLNEQLKAIQNELDPNSEKSDLKELEKKIEKSNLSLEAKEKAYKELKKLKYSNQILTEFSTIRNYLDTLLSMPWGKVTLLKKNMKDVEENFHEKHFGLDKIKERILEHIAILKRSSKIKGPVICLVGPPGVGKTSLISSIAEAMGYKYVKFSLGGVYDESEIRGHRRTYVGSMPGKIISLIQKAKIDNPIMLLDEIDKISSLSGRGDPTSALLEVLDPEQNAHFHDNYLDVEYDLSKIIFIATANSTNIPRALHDRLEIIRVSGYLEEEKLTIAKKHLIQKQRNMLELSEKEFSISDEAIIDIIRYYTKESGVRELERMIAKLARKLLLKAVTDNTQPKVINAEDLEKYLGIRKYDFCTIHQFDKIGCTNALAYTEYGGELLKIEAALVPGEGKIKTTGRLGDVMKESVETAYSCVLSQFENFQIDLEKYKTKDIHLHFPEGATPKDGPSAGIAIFTTIISLMKNQPVKKEYAMTGEITLHGTILPIGGLKEKLLAARRGGISNVLIPKHNEKDLEEIPQTIKSELSISPVSQIEDILALPLFKNIKSTY